MAAAGPMRSANRSAVLSVLLSGRLLDRNQIIDSSQLSRATVFRIVDDLRGSGLVTEHELKPPPGPGRPPIGIQLVAGARRVCGVDLGGTRCRLVLSDLLGRTIARSEHRTPGDLDGAGLAAWIAARVADLGAESVQAGPLGAVAIGLPGAISGDSSTVVASQNLPPIRGAGFIKALHRAIGVPVTVENDSNLALLGELRYGTLAPDETVSLLAIGTGLGSATAIDGHVLRSRDGRLGEFGRLNLPGSKVRIRDLVSGAGLVGYAQECGFDISDAREVLVDTVRYSGLHRQVTEALVHLVAIVALAYEPRAVLLTGGFSHGLDETLLQRVSAEVTGIVGVPVSLRRTSLGDHAGLYGALASALDGLYRALGVLPDHLDSIEVDRALVTDLFDHAAADERKES
ncbi:ROK family protein [Microlunatus sp. Gsoil 973]|uniref:ROK family protein n=1 Tax=Microlunatus sp. Gsoil 973 TaxID=2672569 RepID=UPI0012B4E56F|nr:ROK family protein [Microlunatus sp. Gsoil 973]QGN32971.1 ROK family protein [Microlunatus sp. Gsoil 973]